MVRRGWFKRYRFFLLAGFVVYSIAFIASIYTIGIALTEKQITCPKCPHYRNVEEPDQLQKHEVAREVYQTLRQPDKSATSRSVIENPALDQKQVSGNNTFSNVAFDEEDETNHLNPLFDLTDKNDTVLSVKDTEPEKIDWNDYAFYMKESERRGLGENGTAAELTLSDEERAKEGRLFKKYNFNAYLSDRISLERSVSDFRSLDCQKQKFIKDIPENSVSFITVFHNEKNSTLLRTVHAIINRTPAKLLREIILVDDVSTDNEVLAPLDEYIAQHFTNVQVLRNTERLGLIKSRMRGADISRGMFLVFLDAHVEVGNNYLPPLLEPMISNYKTVACPMIDNIKPDTFRMSPLGDRFRGGFDWSMAYKRLIDFNITDETTPFANPAMVGCAFAITRRWWEELGKYDPGLEIWGAEQYELSFKSWQCGGRVVDAPCSRVAHVFRPLPYVKEVTHDNVIERNYLRIASVWMDEYKDFVLQRRPLMREEQPGDISQQLELRKKLSCKPFKWFMEEVAPDILKNYPVVEPPAMAWGFLQSQMNNSLCVTIAANRELKVDKCERKMTKEFVYDWRWRIRQGKKYDCFAHTGDQNIFMWECLDMERRPTQRFVWNRQNGRLVAINTGFCMDMDIATQHIYTAPCNETSQTQGWQFEVFNATLVDDTWNRFMKPELLR